MSSPIFVVQEHHASRLHYDFRLEIGGALKSWAIPKGPSMNPAEKRLAVMVDDHPLDYGSFEGVIPEGRYGAGAVVVWDTGTFELLEGTDTFAGLTQGSLKFSLNGKRLKGAFALVKLHGPRATGKEWLLMKKLDEDADPQFVLESALTPAKRRQLKETIPPCDTS
ncbi:MAG: 3'-phosphoesterase [Candidatus Omnitrophica bacterium]|nr:3'-phosphoesterase [Candidatus Omnitrophota bacterium]MBI3021646.1 3'-phosphoesterase [Candidatus Omnitrophota bacterium]